MRVLKYYHVSANASLLTPYRNMDNFPIGGSKYPRRVRNSSAISFKGSNCKWSKFEIKRIAFPGASIVIHDISSKDCRARRWNSMIQGETRSVPRLIRGKSAPVVKLYHRGSKWNWSVRSSSRCKKCFAAGKEGWTLEEFSCLRRDEIDRILFARL